MSEAKVRCPKCGHEGIVITELLHSDFKRSAELKLSRKLMEAKQEIERLRARATELDDEVQYWRSDDDERYAAIRRWRQERLNRGGVQ